MASLRLDLESFESVSRRTYRITKTLDLAEKMKCSVKNSIVEELKGILEDIECGIENVKTVLGDHRVIEEDKLKDLVKGALREVLQDRPLPVFTYNKTRKIWRRKRLIERFEGEIDDGNSITSSSDFFDASFDFGRRADELAEFDRCPVELPFYKAKLEKQLQDAKMAKERRRDPEIVIYNVEQHTVNEIKIAIEAKTEEDVVAIKKVTSHSGVGRAFATVTPTALEKLEEDDDNILFICGVSYRFERHVSIMRCFKCLRFGHRVLDCRTSVEALTEIKALRNKDKCSNCLYREIFAVKKETQSNIVSDEQKEAILMGIDHNVYSSNCPVFISLREKLSTRYNYY